LLHFKLAAGDYNLNLKMESDGSDDGFGRQKAEDALDIGQGFDSEEEQDDLDDDEIENQPLSQPRAAADDEKKPTAAGPMKGAQVDNQPYDLAVDVNDSEEIESDEEADEVNVPQSMQPAGQKQPQNNQGSQS